MLSLQKSIKKYLPIEPKKRSIFIDKNIQNPPKWAKIGVKDFPQYHGRDDLGNEKDLYGIRDTGGDSRRSNPTSR